MPEFTVRVDWEVAVRAEVRRPSGRIDSTIPNAMVAMTNPIFLGKP